AGAVAIETAIARRAFRRDGLVPKLAIATVIAAAAAPIAVALLPFLPPEKLVAYQRSLGISHAKTEVNHEGPLEQRLGDQLGWPELVADVAKVYESLPPDVRAKTGIFASNYGEAGALHLFGPAHGLPNAI